MNIPNIALSNGINMPVLGLGTWDLTGRTCERAVKDALSMGYTHIDTADIYRNHEEVGRAIKGFQREKLFITTKVWPGELDYDGVISACNRALDELSTGYIDLYLIHWPNPRIPLKESFEAFKKLYGEKKIRAFGVSNFSIRLLKEALLISKVPITVNQVEFHPFLYQKELLEFCNKNNIKITAYSPLARGRVFRERKIVEISKKYGKTPGQVALRWLFEKGLLVIPKASTKEHLKENMEIFDFQLNKEDTKTLDSLPQHRIISVSQ